MLEESLRRRLETLNRERLPAGDAAKGSEGHLRGSSVPPTLAKRGSAVRATRVGGARLLDSAVVCENAGGEHLVIPIPVDSLWREGERLVAGRLVHLESLPAEEIAEGMSEFVAAMPDRALLLDLETCGLGGAALFLVGLLRKIDGRLTVELLLAKNYAGERAVLEALWQRIEGEVGTRADAIVTFNGKSFDWPTVLDRSRRHLLHKSRELRSPLHVDVLHPARRRWKTQLPDCKLQTIERLICRRTRTGDIPGSQIPAAYDAFVRTGNPTEMEAILYHNAIDLVTLLDVAMRIAA